MKRQGRRTPPYGVPAAPLRADLARIIDAHGYACLQWHVEGIADDLFPLDDGEDAS